MTIARFIDRTLNTSATPLAYLVALQSLVFGLSFALFEEWASVKDSILYPYGIWIGVPLWGWVLVVSAIGAILGLAYKNRGAVEVAGFLLFSAWTFATIAYVQNDAWFQACLASINILYAGYFFLASSLRRLWDYTPER